MLNLRKKLLVSIFTLMLALVAVSTTTYAWFTLGNTAEISSVELGVQGADGLTVRITSLNGETDVTKLGELSTWKISHDLSDSSVYDVVLKPLHMESDGKLYAISAVDQNTGAPIYEPTAAAVSVDKSPYVEITFEFRSESKATVQFKDLQAKADASHTFASPISVIAGQNVGYGTPAVAVTEHVNNIYTITKARLANALRVAVKNPAEPAWNYINPRNYDHVTGEGADTYHYGTWGGAALAFFNELTDGTELVAPKEYVYKGSVVDDEGNVTDDKNSYDLTKIDLVTLEEQTSGDVKYYTGSVTVVLWLEGFDADCFNAIISDSALFDFSFTAKSAA